MAFYRVTAIEPVHGVPATIYTEAECAEDAERILTGRGMVEVRAEPISYSEIPPDVVIQIGRPPAPAIPPEQGRIARRILLVLLGIGIGLFLAAMFLFVLKAREHLGLARPR